MTTRISIGVFVAFVASGGAARAAPIKVAGVGDSITQLSQWPQKLGTLLGAGYAATNYGVSGTTLLKKGDSPYWSTTAFTQSHADNPDIVVIMLGTNDSKPFNWNAHEAEFVGDYEALIDSYTALPSHPKVYLNLCPPAGTNGYMIDGTVIANEILPLIKQIATAKGVSTIDVYDAFGGAHLDPSLYGSATDLVHPNDKGGMVIAQTVYAALTSPPPDAGVDGAYDGVSHDGSLADAALADAALAADASSTASSTASTTGGASGRTAGASGTAGDTGAGGSSTGAGGAATGAGGVAAAKSSDGCALAAGTSRASELVALALALAFARVRGRRR
jgi:lysophospholipase L1-like esterase